MLGSLARWLRFYGFDTLYPEKPLSDIELITLASKEGRVLVTRDSGLTARRKPACLKTVYIKSDLLESQFEELARSLNLKIDYNNIMVRCSLCNTLLSTVSKKSVKGKVPDGVYRRHRIFWFCSKCTKYYWKGSHWNMILRRLKALSRF